MDTKSGLVNNSVFGVFLEAYKHYKEIREAYNDKKWYRFTALLIFTLVMVAVVVFAKPLLAAYLLKGFIGMGWLPLPVCKGLASCVTTGITTQLRNHVKRWILKIDR
ncbi:hypothetical protein J1782_01820 [Rahnella sp. BCC 1045]|uniref:hypothetical protein n=1 Tax=Rahnella sp. BCC 1045 TaxID=2816251 RepID=UPI001C278CD8|nr:hypothetical protein [Rahnella sp. BCC 1045]MBU9818627.1 hypothetical protein [Rahnella sp. BCC 1045]